LAIKKSRRKFTILIPESMAPKSDNSKKPVAKNNAAGTKVDAKKNSTSPVEKDEDLDDDDFDELDEEVTPKTTKSKSVPKSKKAKADDEEDDDADVEEDVADDWEKTEDDPDWDPDFDEFDIPKSGAKKVGKKKPADDDDLKIDDDFKEFGLFDDMDGSGSTGFDDEDDF
jgi:nucleolin